MSSAAFASAELRELFGAPLADGGRDYASVSADTRAMERGALFVALRGERFDGTDFLTEAADKGALGAVVPEGTPAPHSDFELFLVPDTTRALGALAHHHRMRSGARVIAVTGTSGKTTVKEMLAHALTGDLETHRSAGNLNNRIGLPLSILAAPATADIWVLELGSSQPGEIAELTGIAAPRDALVTTIGPAHLAGFGSLQGVLDEKMSVVRGAAADGMVVVGELPAELPRAVKQLREGAKVAGLKAAADFRPDTYEVGAREVTFMRGGTRYRVSVGGEHHLRDALMAAAMAEELGLPAERVAEGLAEFRPLGMRGELRRLGDLELIADCYNANPESFAAAIRYCRDAFARRRRVAVVGTMRELGAQSGAQHSAVARLLIEGGFELIVACGEFAAAFASRQTGADRAEVLTAESPGDIWPLLADRLRGDEVVLVKASRGERLERVVAAIESAYAGEVS